MTYYKAGSWNIICQVCGRKFKSDEVKKRWDGLIVCNADFENRHILDFIKVREDDPAVPYVAPEPTDHFIYLCSLKAGQGKADVSEADCGRADINLPIEF